MKNAILAAVLCATLAGCSLLSDTDGGGTDAAHVADVVTTEVEVKATTGRSVSFVFEGATPDPCHAFEKAVVTRDGTTVDVRVRARRTAEVCIMIIGTLHVDPLVVEVPGPGTYRFAFWRGADEEPLVVTVTNDD